MLHAMDEHGPREIGNCGQTNSVGDTICCKCVGRQSCEYLTGGKNSTKRSRWETDWPHPPDVPPSGHAGPALPTVPESISERAEANSTSPTVCRPAEDFRVQHPRVQPLEALINSTDSDDDLFPVIADGAMYVGSHGFAELERCEYLLTEKLEESYITTAVLRRSGLHPDTRHKADRRNRVARKSAVQRRLQEHRRLYAWLCGDREPDSTSWSGTEHRMDQTVVLNTFKPKVHIAGVVYHVVPSSEMRVLVGTRLAAQIRLETEKEPSPLRQKTLEQCETEIDQALTRHCATIQERDELTDPTRAAVRVMLRETYHPMWRAKYDLEEPASLPPMRIELVPGARPIRVSRSYNWTAAQRKWLREHLRKLVDAGIISRVQSNWCCPIVLVMKDDLTWRLCVDPNSLNRVTVPMTYDMPKMRELIQSSLQGMRWMCRFDFMSMFWQIPLMRSPGGSSTLMRETCGRIALTTSQSTARHIHRKLCQRFSKM